MRWLLSWVVTDACTVVCVACWDSVMVRGWRQYWYGGWMRCGCGEYMLTCSMRRFLSLLLLGMCPYGVSVVMWFVCTLMWVAHVGHVWCQWCQTQLMCYESVWCVGWEELVKCVRCVCVWLGRRGWRGGEWMRLLGLGFNNPVRTGGGLDVWLCYLRCSGMGGIGGEWVEAWTRVWMGGVVLCLCEMWVWILCVDGRSRYMFIVIGGYLRIWGAPSVQSCFTLWILLPNMYLFIADITNPDSFVWCCLGITRFYEEQRQPSSGSAWLACPQNGKLGPYF